MSSFALKPGRGPGTPQQVMRKAQSCSIGLRKPVKVTLPKAPWVKEGKK